MRRRARPVPTAVVGALVGVLVIAGCSSAGPSASSTASTEGPATATTGSVVTSAAATAPASTHPERTPKPAAAHPKLSPRAAPTSRSVTIHPAGSRPAHPARRDVATAQRLPLHDDTGDAQQVITVVAPSATSTTATLQTWTKSRTGWTRVGPAVPAYLGSDGIGQASESTSTTPAGSYTLTRAFGHDADPGTALPYTRTTPADWWISQPGPLYNTRQRCSSGCSFTQGDPNEHLYYETPFYDYAVVIDYNTPNAPGGVRPGAGSAFFLHVTVHQPTQGCVSIDQDQLVRVLRWLEPDRHPRIILGIR